MSGRHTIDLALDLARMPALARMSVPPAIPVDVVELLRIAAAHPQSCQAACAKTGESKQALIEAARFYIQQVLLRPEADSFRILGIDPTTSRATARLHMRLLLQWLHPDHNGSWDTVYAERVLKAWREVSGVDRSEIVGNAPSPNGQKQSKFTTIRVPWIEHPISRPKKGIGRYVRAILLWGIPAGAVIVFLALWSVLNYFGIEEIGATPLR